MPSPYESNTVNTSDFPMPPVNMYVAPAVVPLVNRVPLASFRFHEVSDAYESVTMTMVMFREPDTAAAPFTSQFVEGADWKATTYYIRPQPTLLLLMMRGMDTVPPTAQLAMVTTGSNAAGTTLGARNEHVFTSIIAAWFAESTELKFTPKLLPGSEYASPTPIKPTRLVFPPTVFRWIATLLWNSDPSCESNGPYVVR
jgi:hypothetical protein